ncbi:alpha/beta hydrolase [Methylotenera mobilis]|uniref:Carboxylesterase n=1 Tax=Methylotenera mobilis (strain JLW8 / ATCC BAA-1282 / DSM 17540) TaxID=583345 RepID=C6WUB8_METML|nr:alpha/beta fold hydrolase [Methylotenera mobilis]ACT47517.1 Carboxylesterase [Methylotenera mobilis JLW8]
MTTYQPPLELSLHTSNPSKISASVIWMHGLGADGYDFEPIVQRILENPAFSHIRFILPHAPDMAVTRNNGYIMPAWYDIYGQIPVLQEDEAGIKASENYINTLINNEINKGINPERILLAGFSQGGAIALHTALRYPQKLAGVMALSTYVPLHALLSKEANVANVNTPIFMAHGIFDDIIPLSMAEKSRNLLQTCQYSVSWHQYNMAHSLCEQEIIDIESFLTQVLS